MMARVPQLMQALLTTAVLATSAAAAAEALPDSPRPDTQVHTRSAPPAAMSDDEGGSWRTIARHLPEIYSVVAAPL